MTEHQKSFENQSPRDKSSSLGPTERNTERKKRRRSLSSVDGSTASDEESVDHGNNSVLPVDERTKHQTPKVMTGVRLPGLVYPTSLYNDDRQAITTVDSEEDVLKSALVRITVYRSYSFHLTDFELQRRNMVTPRLEMKNSSP